MCARACLDMPSTPHTYMNITKACMPPTACMVTHMSVREHVRGHIASLSPRVNVHAWKRAHTCVPRTGSIAPGQQAHSIVNRTWEISIVASMHAYHALPSMILCTCMTHGHGHGHGHGGRRTHVKLALSGSCATRTTAFRLIGSLCCNNPAHAETVLLHLLPWAASQGLSSTAGLQGPHPTPWASTKSHCVPFWPHSSRAEIVGCCHCTFALRSAIADLDHRVASHAGGSTGSRCGLSE